MYKQILFPVDLSEIKDQEKALETTIRLAETFSAAVYVLAVVPDYVASVVGSYLPQGYQEELSNETREKLKNYVSNYMPNTIEVNQIVAHGTIYNEILNTAKNLEIDLIVMASHRPEFKDYLLGPNAARVFRHANCSTMVVRT